MLNRLLAVAVCRRHPFNTLPLLVMTLLWVLLAALSLKLYEHPATNGLPRVLKTVSPASSGGSAPAPPASSPLKLIVIHPDPGAIVITFC